MAYSRRLLGYLRTALVIGLTFLLGVSLGGFVLHGNTNYSRVVEFQRDERKNILFGFVHLGSYASKIVLQYWVAPIDPAKHQRVVYSAKRLSISHSPARPEDGVFYGTVEVSAPLWTVVVVSGIYPAFELLLGIRRRRRRARRRAGLCTKCGYDLRGSSGRCPECGTPFDPSRVKEDEPPAVGDAMTS